MADLEKLKFKVTAIPNWSFFLYMLGFLFLLVGTVANYVVIQSNDGDMPVWTNNLKGFQTAVKLSEEHFEIRDANSVKYLHLGDIYHVGDRIYSIGDGLMILGLVVYVTGAGIHLYNRVLDFLLVRKPRGKR